MSATTYTSSNFQFIFDAALSDYLKQTGVDLIKYPFAEKLQNCQSADAIIELFQDKANQFKEYRDGNSKLINCLNPVVKVIHAFSGVLGEAAGVVSLLFAYNQITFYVLCIQMPFQAIFVSFDVLLSVRISLVFPSCILIISGVYCRRVEL